MSNPSQPRNLQFVVKLSKYCNLRCTYCYEYRELGNKRRMALEEIRRMFENVASHAEAEGLAYVNFIWHGGEPFLIPIEFYQEILAVQREVFADRVPAGNSIQTNLTVLTDRHVDFVKGGTMFRGIGVSFDVYGTQRVDIQGKLRTRTVLRNMQTLIDQGIGFGAIAVLSRDTLAHATEIYRFYDRLGVESRFLPFYMSSMDEQIDRHALTHEEIVGALTAIFDAWMQSERATPVDPLDEYLRYALSFLADSPKWTYDKRSDECVYVVDVDGGVWSVGEAYDPAYRQGNVFDEDLGRILDSPARERAIAEAEERMATHCKPCKYFGHCRGYFVGDATPEQQQLLAGGGCTVRPVLDHIVHRLQQTDLADAFRSGRESRIENPALEVGM